MLTPLWALTIVSSGSPAQPPHIIKILADDLGWNDVGFSGAGNRMLTPHLDALARTGVILTDYHTFKFCSPSRTQILTGRYAYHLGQQTGLNMNPATGCEADSTNGRERKYMCSVKCGVPLGYKMLPALLKTRGYRTHALGKWHQGFFSANYTPTYRGFDTYFGSYTNNDHFTHVSPYGAVPKRCPWWTPASNGSCPVAGCLLLQDLVNSTGATIRPADPSALNGTYSAPMYATEAARLIRSHPDAAIPLFLYLAFVNVHDPKEAPAASVARYDGLVTDPTRKLFGGMASALDEAVHTVVEALKHRGLWANTVLVFSTDNGSPISNGGNNAPLRGSKMTDWQGGVRGVAFVTSPRRDLLPAARANKTWGGLASQTDLYRTLAALAGVPEETVSSPSSGPVPPDSLDLWGALASGGASPRLELVHNINGKFAGAIRVGAFKLLVGDPNEAGRGRSYWRLPPEWGGQQGGGAGAGGGAWGGARRGRGGEGAGEGGANSTAWCTPHPCLFDVLSDPEERTDLHDAMPSKVAQLMARYRALQASEVSLPDSGLCPKQWLDPDGWPGVSAPDGCLANVDGGTWLPWVK
jgi:arylsulfatase B